MMLPFQGVQPMVLSFQGVQATGPVPIHQLWMLPSPSPILSYVMALMAGSVFTTAGAQPSTATTVAPTAAAATTSAVTGGLSHQHR
jgi:ethanolamine transporter EutH